MLHGYRSGPRKFVSAGDVMQVVPQQSQMAVQLSAVQTHKPARNQAWLADGRPGAGCDA
jgi:hypothetical protein